MKYRYALFERKDLESKIIWHGNNKQELKVMRTSWRYQLLMPNIYAEIYDYKQKLWLP